MSKPPQSGNFLGAADNDLLSSALLYEYGQLAHPIYHGVQAVEKYLKARFIWTHENSGALGTLVYNANEKFLRTHNLAKLYDTVEQLDPTLKPFPWRKELCVLAELDQATRYPYVEQKHKNGFSSADFELCILVAMHLRPGMVYHVDDYPLGMALRGYFIRDPQPEGTPSELGRVLKKHYSDANQLVWWPNQPPGAVLKRRFAVIN